VPSPQFDLVHAPREYLEKAPQEVQTDFKLGVAIPTEKIAATLIVLILTEDLLTNETIIDEGLRAFVAIVKDLGWLYGYVMGASTYRGCWAESSSKGLFRSRVRSA
jgi:hypothetical protein